MRDGGGGVRFVERSISPPLREPDQGQQKPAGKLKRTKRRFLFFVGGHTGTNYFAAPPGRDWTLFSTGC